MLVPNIKSPKTLHVVGSDFVVGLITSKAALLG